MGTADQNLKKHRRVGTLKTKKNSRVSIGAAGTVFGVIIMNQPHSAALKRLSLPAVCYPIRARGAVTTMPTSLFR